VRIGIDMLAVQSPGSRGRGVGRYAHHLVRAILNDRGGRSRHEFVLYAHEGLPRDEIPDEPGSSVVALRAEPGQEGCPPRALLTRLAEANPDALDVILTLNPFELDPGYEAAPRLVSGPKCVAVVYDLIPFLFPEVYLTDSRHAAWMHRRLRALARYDRLLTISECTRRDCLDRLGLEPGRVVTIGGATDPTRFRPDTDSIPGASTRQRLAGLGIEGSFVFSLSGVDPRKNLDGLIRAFAQVDPSLRSELQLVITCYLRPGDRERYERLAVHQGVGGRVILTGEVSDDELRLLYQRCAAFVFPSRYEGLGLPLLEAMHCGAPVIGGDNSSQGEVVGHAGLLVDADDSGAIAGAIERVRTDASLVRRLQTAGPARAATFRWPDVARRALESIDRLAWDRPLVRRPKRGRIAVYSPWPPRASGISTYSARLVEAIGSTYEVDLIHDGGYVPATSLGDARWPAYDHRLLPRLLRTRDYRGVLYQMGNSFYHRGIYDGLTQFGGIASLHDFLLAGFHWWRSNEDSAGRGDELDRFGREVERGYPARAPEIMPQLEGWRHEPGGMQEAFTRRRLFLNRQVFEQAEAVVVHSPWCLDRVREEMPELAAKVRVIPQGVMIRPCDLTERAGTRARFGLATDALVLGIFGYLTQSKMLDESLEAFRVVHAEFPSAVLVLAGPLWDQDHLPGQVRALGLESSVRFVGRVDDAAFESLMATTDIGLALRRPPTYGETSATLLGLLAQGVASVVIDVDTYGDYPESIVQKVRWERDGLPGLIQAIRGLAADAEGRRRLGTSARAFVASRHSWARVAAEYVRVIEEVQESRRGRHSAIGA
jgi:glycosyltransferase involved in cell wall biosynthesis